MIKQLQVSRTCSICGQKKPLVAFLELAGDKGHTFGDICATCRGSGRSRKKTSEEPGDRSAGTTRLQIDNKARVQLEHDRKEQLKQHEEQDYEEKLKKETAAEEKTTAEKQHDEEKTRDESWQQKRQDLKGVKVDPNGVPTREGQMIQAQGFYNEKTRATQEFHKQVTEQKPGKKTIGLSAQEIQRYVSATGRSAESLFGQVLGQFMRNHLQADRKKNNPTQQKVAEKTAVTEKAAPAEGNKTDNPDNSAADFVKNNFKKR